MAGQKGRQPHSCFSISETDHQSITVTAGSARVTVLLDIVPDEDNPYAVLSAQDDGGEVLAEVRVPPSFQLKRSSAVAWVEGGFSGVGER